jgi:hypothetical protein
MHDASRMMFMIALAAIVSLAQLARALKTGRAPMWPGGVATRNGQPKRYWRFVVSSVVVVAGCVVAFAWVMLDPVTFR